MDVHILHPIIVATTFHVTLGDAGTSRSDPPTVPVKNYFLLVIVGRPHGFFNHKSVIAFPKFLRSVELSEVSSLSMVGYSVHVGGGLNLHCHIMASWGPAKTLASEAKHLGFVCVFRNVS